MRHFAGLCALLFISIPGYAAPQDSCVDALSDQSPQPLSQNSLQIIIQSYTDLYLDLYYSPNADIQRAEDVMNQKFSEVEVQIPDIRARVSELVHARHQEFVTNIQTQNKKVRKAKETALADATIEAAKFNVCLRTPEIRRAIEEALNAHCDQIPTRMLGMINKLHINGAPDIQKYDLTGLAELREIHFNNQTDAPLNIKARQFGELKSLLIVEIFSKTVTFHPKAFVGAEKVELINFARMDSLVLTDEIFAPLHNLVYARFNSIGTLALDGGIFQNKPFITDISFNTVSKLELHPDQFDMDSLLHLEFDTIDTLTLNKGQFTQVPADIILTINRVKNFNLTPSLFSPAHRISFLIYSGKKLSMTEINNILKRVEFIRFYADEYRKERRAIEERFGERVNFL